jgi:hypothetical protein
MRDGRYLKDSECRAIIGSKPQTLVIIKVRRGLENTKQDCRQETKDKQTHNVMHDLWPARLAVSRLIEA